MENNTILHYIGIIQYETIGELIHSFKHEIHARGVQTGTYKKILLVMIESLENIMKHSECCPENLQDIHPDYMPSFSIEKKVNQFVIATANLIKRQNTPSFKFKLDYLNTLDQQGLKEYYKETITNGEFTNRGGAGLGLIEIAKISCHKIDYDFEPVDDHCDRFSMIITIDDTLN